MNGYSPAGVPPPQQHPASDRQMVEQLLQGSLARLIRQTVRAEVSQAFGSARPSRWDQPSMADQQPRRLSPAEVAESFEAFNPDDASSDVERWLAAIDELGAVNGWTSYERSCLMQSKLRGQAAGWLSALPNGHEYTWGVWKKLLCEAFPPLQDFGRLLEECALRVKRPQEPMTEYFRAKVQLLRHCGVVGERAVSCVIRGLPEQLRGPAYAAGFTMPEALYTNYLMRLEEACPPQPQPPPPPQPQQQQSRRHQEAAVFKPARHRPSPADVRKATTNRQGKAKSFGFCYNCLDPSHKAKECPKPRLLACRRCKQVGHKGADCPLRPPPADNH